MTDKDLKELNEQLDALGKSIDAKLDEFSAKAKEASKEDVEKLKTSIKAEIEPELKKYNDLNAKLQAQVDNLETTLKRFTVKGDDRPMTFVEAMKAGIKQLEEKGKFRDHIRRNKGIELELKIDDMTQGVNIGAGVIQDDKRPGIWFDPDRTEHIRDLLPVGTTTSNTVSYVYESAYADNTDVTAEGLEYKQGDFDLALQTATVRKITAYLILSEEMLEDVEGLTSYINTRLPSKLRVKEDQQLLYGSGGGVQLSGLTVNATAYTDALADSTITRLDVLVDAARQMRSNEYQATAHIINPVDATLIKLTKDSTGNYIHPWIFMPNGQIVLDGVPVFVTTAITSGQFLTGDFRRGAQIFDRRQLTLEFSYENEDNFVKGMVTVRIAERLTLATYRSKAFIYGSFAAALAEGTA